MELIIKYIQEKDHVHIRLTQYECICKHTEMILLRLLIELLKQFQSLSEKLNLLKKKLKTLNKKLTYSNIHKVHIISNPNINNVPLFLFSMTNKRKRNSYAT